MQRIGVQHQNSLETLLEIEERMWWALNLGTAPAFFREELSDGGMVVLPCGAMDKTALQQPGALPDFGRWSFTVDDPRTVELTADSVVLTYRLTTAAEGQPDCVAAASSTYVRRDGKWTLAFHQQTPLAAAPTPASSGHESSILC